MNNYYSCSVFIARLKSIRNRVTSPVVTHSNNDLLTPEQTQAIRSKCSTRSSHAGAGTAGAKLSHKHIPNGAVFRLSFVFFFWGTSHTGDDNNPWWPFSRGLVVPRRYEPVFHKRCRFKTDVPGVGESVHVSVESAKCVGLGHCFNWLHEYVYCVMCFVVWETVYSTLWRTSQVVPNRYSLAVSFRNGHTGYGNGDECQDHGQNRRHHIRHDRNRQ